jgi:hypothetical protein
VHEILVALLLVHLIGPGGQRIDVNPARVTSVREPIGTGHWTKGTNCVLVMSNNRVIALREECATVRVKLGGEPESKKGPCVLVCGEARKPEGVK